MTSAHVRLTTTYFEQWFMLKISYNAFRTNQRFAVFRMLFLKTKLNPFRDLEVLWTNFSDIRVDLVFLLYHLRQWRNVIYVNSLLRAQYFNVSTDSKLILFLFFTTNEPHGVNNIVCKKYHHVMLSASYCKTQINSTHFSYPQMYKWLRVWANCQNGL